MPFLGNTPSQGFTNSVTKDDFTPNGSTTAFTLSKASNTNNIEVYVGNVRQEPASSYSVSGTTLNMTEAPATGTNFYVMHESGSSAISLTPAAGTSVPGAFGVSGALTAASAGVTGNTTVGGTLVNTGLITASAGVAIGGTGSANTLDDYEEGTWTPILKFDNNNTGMVFTAQAGFYTKVGNLVTVNSYYSLSDKGSSNGAAQIYGLPFVPANVTNNYIPVSLGFSGVSFADMMIGYTGPNFTKVNLREVSNAGSHTTIVQSNVANSGDMMMSVTYRTA
jgi:hypothetical protein